MDPFARTLHLLSRLRSAPLHLLLGTVDALLRPGEPLLGAVRVPTVAATV